MRFYRNLQQSHLINYRTGQSRSSSTHPPAAILFSKRDLLIKNTFRCKNITQVPASSQVAYLLHRPNSFYALKSGLKFLNKESFDETGNFENKKNPLFIKVKNKKNDQSGYKFARSFAIKPRLFFEKIDGTQITNSTSATISGKLSPGLNIKFTQGEHKDWQYGASADLDFHIFNERAGEFTLNNNSVQTLGFNVFSNFKLHHRFSALFLASLYEDIYYARTSASSLSIEKELVPRLAFAIDAKVFSFKNFSVNFLPQVFYDLKSGPLMSGNGYNAPIVFEFIRNDQTWSIGVEYSSLQKELSDLDLERSNLSFFIETKVSF